MNQIKSLSELRIFAQKNRTATISVACAEDKEVLQAVESARSNGIANAILVGSEIKIRETALRLGINIDNYQIVDCQGNELEVALEAVKLVSSGKASILMKGMVSTANFLRAVLDKTCGLRSGKTLSHAYIHEINGFNRLLFITDAAFNISPDLKTKISIIKNVTGLAHAFGIENPKIAVLASVEVVNDKMPTTVDAALLTQMNRRGQITGCTIDGPLALDNAVSPESAKHKKIVSPVAGQADVLVAPDIEAGNILAKSIVYFAENQTAGILLGAAAPVVLTSRADSPQTKLNSIATAVVLWQAFNIDCQRT